MKNISIQKNEPKAYIIHENKPWIIPLIERLEELGTPYEEWFLNEGTLDISKAPPPGVFYNRMSASSHTRDNRYAVEYTGPILAWLEAHNRKVLNGRRALQLEVRKIEQYISLQSFNIRTPKTFAAVGKLEILKAVEKLDLFPFILKPNRGGKGLDVRLFHTMETLKEFLKSAELATISLDGVFLIQEYIKPAQKFITRMEFIGGKFLYAVKVDTSDGFELCPADTCQINHSSCPASPEMKPNKFEIINKFHTPEISRLEAFLSKNDIAIAGIEFVENELGDRYFYDVNTNTNYNRKAEIRNGSVEYGMHSIAQLLTKELKKGREIRSNRFKSFRIKRTKLAYR